MKRLLSLLALPCVLLGGCSWFNFGNGSGSADDQRFFRQTVIDRPWTLDSTPALGTVEAPTVSFWRQRYAAWRSGTLTDYPFEPAGYAPAPKDPTPMGRINARGETVTQPSVEIPPRSGHETEAWGDDGCVWPTLNRWSMDWERRYSEWIATVATPSFLVENNIPVDCSDMPYAFRWIFARINYLPMGVHSYNGYVFGNWNVLTENLPTAQDWREDQRFRAALNHALEAYTRGASIPYDTYPIDIRPEAGMLRPGTLAADAVHVRMVHKIIPASGDPVRQLAATQPRKLMLLAEETLSSIVDNDGPGWGMVNFSWWDYDFALHRYRCVPDRMMPGFSLNQYEFSDQFICADLIQTWYRDNSVPIDPMELLANRINNLNEMLRVRRDVIQEGWEKYYRDHQNDRDTSSTNLNYDNYSTPSRDKRIVAMVEEIRQISATHQIPWQLIEQEMEKITIPLGEGLMTDMRSVAWRTLQGQLNSDPWNPPSVRWALDQPVPPIGAQSAQPAQAAINPETAGILQAIPQPDLPHTALPQINSSIIGGQ